MRRAIVLWGLLLIPTTAQARKLSLSEAVSLALERSPQVQQAREKLGETEAARKAVRGNLGPKITVDANIFRWDDEVTFAIPPPSAETLQKHGPVLAKYGDLMTALPDLFSFGPSREKVTAQVSASIAQPLTPLYTIAKGHRIASLGRDAAKEGLAAAGDGAIYQATKAYIDLKQVRSAVDIARTAVEQLQAHRDRAQAFLRAGMIGQNEVLKAEVALAQTKEQLIKAESGEALAQSALALALGLSPRESFEPTEVFSDPPPRVKQGLEGFIQRALERRPERKAVAKQVEIARAGRAISKWAFVPQVAAVAAYQHLEGAGFFMPKDAFYVGGVLKWDVWDWGTKYFAVREAGHRVAQVQIGARQLSDGIYLEVKKAFLDLRSAEQTLSVARVSVTQAEESFRIEKARFEKSVSTSTDVLDAQLALTRAKLSYTSALYQWYGARAALSKATAEWSGGAGASAVTPQRDATIRAGGSAATRPPDASAARGKLARSKEETR